MRLGQIRRRLRLRATLEGAVVGGTLAAVALAAGVAIARARGGAVPAGEVVALLVLGLGAGAVARAARRIPLARCARLADAALDGEDRLLSALALEAAPATPFSRALAADAVRRAEALVPGAAVPARRPRGLPALALAASMLAAAALVPASSRAARIAPPCPVAARAPLPPGALDAEREVARAARDEATRLADARLAALAGELDRTLRRLAEGTLSDGAALETLAALEARAAEAAEAARREAAAAAAASRGLAETAETRPAGQALGEAAAGAADEGRADEGRADEGRARDALAASAAAHPAETAKGLAAAARNMAGTFSEAGDGAGANAEDKSGARRLAREQKAANESAQAPAGQQADDSQRQLERLRRDLDDAASACRDGDPSCAARAGERGRDLERLERQGAARDGLQRIARSAQQLRTRIGRRELGLGEQDAQAMRSFGRAARGGDQSGGGEEQSGASAGREGAGETGTAAGEPAGAGEAGRDQGTGRGKGAGNGAASAALGAEAEDAPGQEAGTGNGIGRQPGGPPLGPRATETAPAGGSEAEVPIADGAGPSRAEVIGTAAGQGFASRSYARAYTDYAAAVEDALAKTAVPEGKRYLVRRYFDLIRPRAPARAARHAP
jgi:hypothetical protein